MLKSPSPPASSCSRTLAPPHRASADGSWDTARELTVACLLATMAVFSSQAVLGGPVASSADVLLAATLALASVLAARVTLAR